MIEAIYERRRDSFREDERRLARISLRFSIARGVLFAAFLGCLFWILLDADSPPAAAWAGAVVAFVVFLAILPRHDRVVARQRRAQDLARLNEEALLRIARNWKDLAVPNLPESHRELPLVRDLDLFGTASLFQLLGSAHTPPGKNALADWLLEPASPARIKERQEGVADLAPELDLRQQIEVRSRPMEKLPPDVEPFLRWAESLPWLLSRTGLVWLTRALTVLTPIALLAAAGTDFPAGGFLLLVTFNLGLSYLRRERLADSLNRLESREQELQAYGEVLELVAARAFAAPHLQRIAAELAPRGRPAHEWMDLLHRRVILSDARHSGILHFFLQTLLLWDFHTLYLLEIWQRDAGPHVRKWLNALGDFEALCALASLSHDNPDWAFPRVNQEENRFVAEELGHPLLPAARRVTNDVEVGPPGTFLLVTGSNMSGKSTLLRAIGVNAVLAQAGGPVCARELRMPPLTLATSILVEDSLADGVSFFLAELHRIRAVVDAADRSQEAGRTVLYLLDEVLRGTNSQERQIAVRRVILHLLHRNAIGAVSTHDLQIAEIPELAEVVRPVHFRETLHPGGDPPMTFDYKMRLGVATTTNALRLMELVGLKPEV